MKKSLLALIIALVIVAGIPIPADAGTFTEAGPWEKTGLVSLSIITSVVYTPLKFTYATLGTLTSGLVLGFTGGDDNGTASKIARRSVTGDWWVAPDVFLGNKNLDFVGPESKAESNLESKPETKLENKPESKAESKTESKSENKLESKQEIRPESKSEIKVESIPENQPEIIR